MTHHKGTPQWQHDCDRCRFLGQTIGGGRVTDLYVHETNAENRSPTLIARYGNDGPEYYATDANYANPNGHSELWSASYLWVQEEKQHD